MENWYAPTAVAHLPDVKNVLVLAPHPDDEVFGSAGTLARLRQAGAKIHVCVLTDGAGYATDEQRARIFALRQEETSAAAKLLNFLPPTFVGMRDRSLAGQSGLVQTLIEQIRRCQADIVFSPSLWEIHPDHLAVARAVTVAAAQLGAAQQNMPELWFYEVGAPLRPNVLIDVTSVWPLKQQAMQCFVSQQTTQDYARHIQALNTYRTYNLPASVLYAEAFYRLKAVDLATGMPSVSDVIGTYAGLQIHAILSAADAQAEYFQITQITLSAALQTSQKTLSTALQASQQLQSRLESAYLKIHELERLQSDFLHSNSWRITAPLRKIGQWVKGLY